MSIIVKLLLLIYLMVMVLVTILSVIWILTAIFTPEWGTKKVLLMKFQKKSPLKLRRLFIVFEIYNRFKFMLVRLEEHASSRGPHGTECGSARRNALAYRTSP
jgi:hypothetical protein